MVIQALRGKGKSHTLQPHQLTEIDTICSGKSLAGGKLRNERMAPEAQEVEEPTNFMVKSQSWLQELAVKTVH